MVRRRRTLIGSAALTLLVGCAGQNGTVASAPARSGTGASPTAGVAPAQAEKTIVMGPTRLDPPNLTLTRTDAVGFVNTGGDPMTMEFIGPKDQSGRITCRVSDPQALKRGEAPWAEFRLSEEGHYKANIPPGRFPSVCSLAPGPYTYVVHRITSGPTPSELRLGQEGTITVR
jgi:hypothetical protein